MKAFNSSQYRVILQSIQGTSFGWMKEKSCIYIYIETEKYTCAGGRLAHTHSH